MTLVTLFKEQQWDAVEETLGKHRVFSYMLVTRISSEKRITLFVDDRYMIHLFARDGFDSRLAEFILDTISKTDCLALPSSAIALFPAAFPKPFAFEGVVVVPHAAAILAHWPEELQAASYLAIPAYKSEFADGMSLREFRHQIGRKDGWRVPYYKWSRAEKKNPSWE